jgi:protein-tyrosine phosphatase
MEISRIAFEQLKNTRDLGQFTTADGRAIRPRHLLRSGNLHNLSLEDRAILQNDYQLKTVIDFRTDTERKDAPDTKINHVTYHWIPILDEATMGITREDNGKNGLQQLLNLVLDANFDAKQYMMHTYRQLILGSYSRSQYRKFFHLLLTAPTDGAILWHCSAGKDRVGIATFLLLCALGVSEDIAADDYLATNTFCAESLNQMITMMVKKTGSKDIIPKIDAMFSVSSDYLDVVRKEIQVKFGGIDAFLEREMGLDEANRIALQERFLMN